MVSKDVMSSDGSNLLDGPDVKGQKMDSYRKPKTPDCQDEAVEDVPTPPVIKKSKKVKAPVKEELVADTTQEAIQPVTDLADENKSVVDSLCMPIDNQSVAQLSMTDKIADMTLGQFLRKGFPWGVGLLCIAFFALSFMAGRHDKEIRELAENALRPQAIREHVVKSFTSQELKGKNMEVSLQGYAGEDIILARDGTIGFSSHPNVTPRDQTWSFKSNQLCLMGYPTCADIQPETGLLTVKGIDVGHIVNVSTNSIGAFNPFGVLLPQIPNSPATPTKVKPFAIGDTPESISHTFSVVHEDNDLSENLAKNVALSIFTFDGVKQSADSALLAQKNLFSKEGYGYETTVKMLRESGRYVSANTNKIVSTASLFQTPQLIYFAKMISLDKSQPNGVEYWKYRVNVLVDNLYTVGNTHIQEHQSVEVFIIRNDDGSLGVSEILAVPDIFPTDVVLRLSTEEQIQGYNTNKEPYTALTSLGTSNVAIIPSPGQFAVNKPNDKEAYITSNVATTPSPGQFAVNGNTALQEVAQNPIKTNDVVNGVQNYVKTIHNLYSGRENYKGVEMAVLGQWNNVLDVTSGLPVTAMETDNGNSFSINVPNVDPDHCKALITADMGSLNNGLNVNDLSVNNKLVITSEQANAVCSLHSNNMKWKFL